MLNKLFMSLGSADVPDAPIVTLDQDVLRWTTPLDNGANITLYTINARYRIIGWF